MRRCRLRGIRRRLGADETHVGTRRGQQHWEAAAQDVANYTKQYSPFPRCPARSACGRRSERRCLQRSRLTSRSAPGGVTLSPRCSAAHVSMGNDWQHWAKWARRGLTAMEQVLRISSWRRGEQGISEGFADRHWSWESKCKTWLSVLQQQQQGWLP